MQTNSFSLQNNVDVFRITRGKRNEDIGKMSLVLCLVTSKKVFVYHQNNSIFSAIFKKNTKKKQKKKHSDKLSFRMPK